MVFVSDQTASAEQVRLVRDEASGLDATIVLHSTALGPAAGGCRLWTYPVQGMAIEDACRLAEGMSYKNALAGLPFGGGKAVLRLPDRPFARDQLFQAFGRAVQELEGLYVTAEDVGTSVADMEEVARYTPHVAGLTPRSGKAGGDPSPWTARGVFLAMEYAVMRHLDRPLSDCRVAIQGVGHVGAVLAEALAKAGTRLVIADYDSARARQVAAALNADLVAPEDILSVDADVFAPCALGAILNHRTIATLAARVICGAANNQLTEQEDGARLADNGVLYAPDYVVNAGGIINVAAEYLRWRPEEAHDRVEQTAARLARVLDFGLDNGLPSNLAADLLARKVIANGAVAKQSARDLAQVRDDNFAL